MRKIFDHLFDEFIKMDPQKRTESIEKITQALEERRRQREEEWNNKWQNGSWLQKQVWKIIVWWRTWIWK